MINNKTYILPANEDWIVDRFVKEWQEDNADITVKNPYDSDVIWLLASWCWDQLIPTGLLEKKKVITTVHHIVPEKFNGEKINNFLLRDKITDVYHVYNSITANFIKNLTYKPIYILPYWANQKIWTITEDKISIRRKYGLPEDAYLIGSFQRDTEGFDLKTPKLEKGPDIFCDVVEEFLKKNKKLHVLLCGWRRQYVISRLKDKNIPFTYFEKPNHKIINDLYQALDLYPVTSRHEGGPQALIECGLLNVPVVSRNVGIADSILPISAIKDNVLNAIPCIPRVEHLKLPYGYEPYRELIKNI
jgi:hypothetical protein